MEEQARLYLCVRCHRQVVICNHCDRGNIYCAQECSRNARLESHRMASKRYQSTYQGKLNHADRQRRYQERKTEKMTHHGSTEMDNDDVINLESDEPDDWPATRHYCHFCHKKVSDFLRVDFLYRRSYQISTLASSSWLKPP